MKEKLNQEITEIFSSLQTGVMEIDTYSNKYPTYAIKDNSFYGIGILNVYGITINENFSNMEIVSQQFEIDGVPIPLIVLRSLITKYDETIFYIFTDFAHIGIDGRNREEITKDPFSWFDKWKELIGNHKIDNKPYSIIGELATLLYEFNNGSKPNWTGPRGRLHDIECLNYHVEVKTSTVKFSNEITISNQFQLDKTLPLYLDFIKMEESNEGYNINDMVKLMVSNGMDENDLENLLAKQGYYRGTTARLKKYKILETRRYLVDDNFPIINEKSFKDGKIPKHIIKITYTVDLTNLGYDSIVLLDEARSLS